MAGHPAVRGLLTVRVSAQVLGPHDPSHEAKEKDGNMFLLWITLVVLDSVGFSWLLPKFIRMTVKYK